MVPKPFQSLDLVVAEWLKEFVKVLQRCGGLGNGILPSLNLAYAVHPLPLLGRLFYACLRSATPDVGWAATSWLTCHPFIDVPDYCA